METARTKRNWPRIEAAHEAIGGWALAEGTLRLYRLAVADFYIFCEDHGMNPEPFDFKTVVRYVNFHKQRPGTRDRAVAPSTVGCRIAALKRLSRTYRDLYGEKWPVLESQALDDAIKKYNQWYYKEKRFRKHQAPPVRVRDLPSAMGAFNLQTVKGRRDATILLLTCAIAARESEVAALDVADIVFDRDVARITWYASKRNTYGHEEVATVHANNYNPFICPYSRLRDWVDELAEHGVTGKMPLFSKGKSPNKWPRQWRRINATDVQYVFERAGEACGIPEATGHSGRRGGAADLYGAGKDVLDVKDKLRLASADVAAGYAKGYRDAAREVSVDVYRQAAEGR